MSEGTDPKADEKDGNGQEERCPRCDSSDLEERRIVSAGNRYRHYVCRRCQCYFLTDRAGKS